MPSTYALLQEVRQVLAGIGASVVVPITDLDPEPFELLRTIHAVVQPADGGYVATFFDANINASGDTQTEAVANLKSYLVDLFEALASREETLGAEPARQLAWMNSVMRAS